MTTPPAACEVLDLPLADLAAALRTGSHSVADVIAACLERIAQRNGPLNAVEAVLAEPALADAARLDALDPAERATLPLFGVPVAIKSEIDVAGVVTTFGGQGNTRPAAADADVVRRLRDAGAVVVATTRMPEFGQAPVTEGGWAERPIPSCRAARLAARPAAPRSPSRPAWWRSRSGAMPAARSASRPRAPDSSASSPPAAA